MAKEKTDAAPKVDTDKDRYPDVQTGIRRILSEGTFAEGPVERIEICFQASGEATYRAWSARADVPEGGYLPPA